MKRIASFEVNHDKLKPGMYTSRIDGDITTYDIRMVYPNAGTYIQPAAGHTFEHLFATYARNSKFADQIIYCGPMGCQTGFEGEIPGASRIECGNYLLHDLAGAKQLAASMIPVLEGWKEENLIYEK